MDERRMEITQIRAMVVLVRDFDLLAL